MSSEGSSTSGGRRPRRLLPAFCNVAGTLMLVCVILSCLPLTIPRFLGYEIYTVVSGSMEPAIPVGSAVYVAETAPEEIQDGDVIAFVSEGSVVTHRVVRNRLVEGEFVTRGDANDAEDMHPIDYEDLIGRVEYHVPFIGQLMVLYTGTVGKIYVICFAACGAMLNMLAGRLRDRAGGD